MSDTTWTWDDEYSTAWAETDDPRVLAIIQRDDEASSPDYDSTPPTLIGYEWGSRADFTTIGGKSSAPEAWLRARNEWDEDTANRFVRIFYEVKTVYYLASSIDRYTWAVVFDAADWREDMGIDPDVELVADDLIVEVQAYLDNDVYGIGYAVNEGRVTDETPVDFSTFNPELVCWGFYGDKYAMQSALDFEDGRPELDTLLDWDEPVKQLDTNERTAS